MAPGSSKSDSWMEDLQVGIELLFFCEAAGRNVTSNVQFFWLAIGIKNRPTQFNGAK